MFGSAQDRQWLEVIIVRGKTSPYARELQQGFSGFNTCSHHILLPISSLAVRKHLLVQTIMVGEYICKIFNVKLMCSRKKGGLVVSASLTNNPLQGIYY